MQILMVETHIWFKFDYSKFLLQQQPADHWLLLIDSIYGLTEKHNKVRASNWWESIINFVILRLRYRVNGAHTELSYWPIWKMLNSKNCENRLIMKDQNGRHHTPERQKTENHGAEIFHTRTICCHSHFTLCWEEPDVILVVWSDPSLLTGVGHNCEGGEGGGQSPSWREESAAVSRLRQDISHLTQ